MADYKLPADVVALISALGQRIATLERSVPLTGTILELASTGTKRQAAFGSITLTWPGASSFASDVVVTHGLGKVPVAVLLGSQFMSASPFAFTPFVNSALGVNTFTLNGFTPGGTPAASTTGVAWWLAIG